jgi:hypothetical protein
LLLFGNNSKMLCRDRHHAGGFIKSGILPIFVSLNIILRSKQPNQSSGGKVL